MTITLRECYNGGNYYLNLKSSQIISGAESEAIRLVLRCCNCILSYMHYIITRFQRLLSYHVSIYMYMYIISMLIFTMVGEAFTQLHIKLHAGKCFSAQTPETTAHMATSVVF